MINYRVTSGIYNSNKEPPNVKFSYAAKNFEVCLLIFHHCA